MLPTIFIPFHVFIFVRDCVKRHMWPLLFLRYEKAREDESKTLLHGYAS